MSNWYTPVEKALNKTKFGHTTIGIIDKPSGKEVLVKILTEDGKIVKISPKLGVSSD